MMKKGNKFVCDICGLESTKKSNLKSHLEVHLNPNKENAKFAGRNSQIQIHLKLT